MQKGMQPKGLRAIKAATTIVCVYACAICSAGLILFIDWDVGVPPGTSVAGLELGVAACLPAIIVWGVICATPSKLIRIFVFLFLCVPTAMVALSCYISPLFVGDLDDSPGIHPILFIPPVAFAYCFAHAKAAIRYSIEFTNATPQITPTEPRGQGLRVPRSSNPYTSAEEG